MRSFRARKVSKGLTVQFTYYLMYEPGKVGGTAANVLALAQERGPVRAVIWDRPTQSWNFRPDVAAAFLYSTPDLEQTRLVDRVTAESATHHFTAVPLPSEAELTRICREAS